MMRIRGLTKIPAAGTKLGNEEVTIEECNGP